MILAYIGLTIGTVMFVDSLDSINTQIIESKINYNSTVQCGKYSISAKNRWVVSNDGKIIHYMPDNTTVDVELDATQACSVF